VFRTRLFLAALLACAAVLAAQAALPTFWQVSTEAEFLQGDVENLSIDPFGRLTLGPATSPVYESSAPFLWTVVVAPDDSAFVGSGNEGQVFKIDPAGKTTMFFDAEELEVHAIALAPGGGIYAASSPDGKIYKVDPAGRSSVFFDPPDKYIWSLLLDRAGNVFAGTGDKGVIYKIGPDGRGAPFYQTKAIHAMSLAFDREGRLVAGTESPGRVFQIDAAGKPFVLLDSPYSEIHTVRVDAKGNIYAAAISGQAPAPDRPPAPAPEPAQPQPVASVTTEVTSITIVAEPPATPAAPPAQAPRAPQGLGAGAVYRISPDGGTDLIWQPREDVPYDLAFDSDGSILVGTGSKGKIYRLSGDPMQPTLVTRALVQQVTTLASDRAGRTLFATANPGKIFRMSAARADRGTYISDVRDAQAVAAWGAIKWQTLAPAGSKVEISTRAGNTRTPDETWSDWSRAYTDQSGSPITSPRARYLQWRAILTGGKDQAPVLTSVTAAYLPRNARPRVTAITIHPPGTVFQRPFPTDPEIAGFEGETPDRRAAAQNAGATGAATNTPALGRRAYQKGLLTFVWRAEDENRDDLSYDVLYRREGDTSWKPLKRGLDDPILVWDTTSVPNGRYVVQVVASDLRSNSPDAALSGSMESTAFDIDNMPPVVTVTSARRQGTQTVLAFEVRDADSAVQKVEYSLDGDRWQAIYPKDGIADSRFEQFDVTLEGDAAVRGVIIRATDALNNVTSARGEAPAAAGR
jgi:outer membrane protein assembly factor BamB